MRCILGYPICGTDEQNYLKILDWLDQGGLWPVSGPGYVALIFQLRDWTGLDTRSLVTGIATLNSALILPLGLWTLYRINLGNARLAWLCLPWLLASSYFLNPWLEGRPQQFGMLLAAGGAWLAHYDLRKSGRCGPGFFLVWIACFGYHALSFVVLTTLVFGFWAKQFLQYRTGYFALATLIIGFIGCLGLGALWYPLIWLDIHTNHVRGMHVEIFFGMLILAVVGGLLALQWLRAHHQVSLSLIIRLRAYLALPLAPWVLAGIVGLSMIWQYAWLDDFYQRLEPALIAWYQGGNILLGTLFLLGMSEISRRSTVELGFFVESCIILMGLGLIFLVLTPWLRDHNWTLRIISYWVWYAAPLAVWGWSGLLTGWRWKLLLLCLPLSIGAVQHTLYAPTWTCSIA